jgi:ferredoxin
MKVIVDMDRCADHGQCVYSAPEVFQLDAAGKLVFEQSPDQALREKIEDAMDVCPMQAISIED